MNITNGQKYLKSIFTVLPIVLLLIISFGCSGGSSGTGARTYTGTVTSDSTVSRGIQLSRVIPGIIVTIAETGESSVTDENGLYNIESDLEVDVITFVFSGIGVDASAQIGNIPSNASRIVADFQISSDGNSASNISISVDLRNEDDDSNDDDDSESDGTSDDNDSQDDGISDDDSTSEDSDSSDSDDDDSVSDDDADDDGESDDDSDESSDDDSDDGISS